MSPYVGEIRLFAGNFAPNGWMFCQGQLLAISENETLFNLIGTTYGGDGQSTFALPNLASRAPVHMGTSAGGSYVIGQMAGEETVTLTVNQIPAHSHVMSGTSDNATTTSPTGNVPATMAEVTTFAYGTDAPTTNLNAQAVGAAGGSQPHDNMPPFLCLNFIISMFGIFPSPT